MHSHIQRHKRQAWGVNDTGDLDREDLYDCMLLFYLRTQCDKKTRVGLSDVSTSRISISFHTRGTNSNSHRRLEKKDPKKNAAVESTQNARVLSRVNNVLEVIVL